MHTYYKAVQPDGTDFFTGAVQWAPPEGYGGEWIVRHPTATEIGTDAGSHLSVSATPTDCLGMEWPCRLFEVEAVGETQPDSSYENKVKGVAFRVVRELDAHRVFGPQGEYVAALIERVGRLTDAETDQLAAAAGAADWGAAVDAAWAAARIAARDAARDAAGDAAGDAAWDAAWGLLVRDLIATEDYDTLTRAWREVIGPIHPDDPDLRQP